MPFDTLSDRLKLVAMESLQLCRNNWGARGLRREEPIDVSIGWQPTFHMRPNRALIVAVEVADVVFPEILKIAAHDIERFNTPISVYQACALDIYQNDPRFAKVNTLRDHVFGIITVDDAGNAIIQCRAEPLAQYIPQEQFDAALRPLTPRLRLKFHAAYATYQANIGQGLQEAGQIIEALLSTIAVQAIAANVVGAATAAKSIAGIIDDLYATGTFHNYRATLGAARGFTRTYRNVSSHPAQTPREAAEKIRKCKAGFFEALRIAAELRETIRALGYQVRVV